MLENFTDRARKVTDGERFEKSFRNLSGRKLAYSVLIDAELPEGCSTRPDRNAESK